MIFWLINLTIRIKTLFQIIILTLLFHNYIYKKLFKTEVYTKRSAIYSNFAVIRAGIERGGGAATGRGGARTGTLDQWACTVCAANFLISLYYLHTRLTSLGDSIRHFRCSWLG